MTWMVNHREYADFKRMLQADPRATRNDLKTIKNPYYLSFQYVLGACLKYKGYTRTNDQTIQVLFDEDIDNRKRLERGFTDWMEVVRLESPHLLSELVNKKAEFRDDKKHPELQAADLLAWHLRKFVYEVAHGNREYSNNQIWRTVHSTKVEWLDLRYEATQWRQLIGRTREPFSPLLPERLTPILASFGRVRR